MLSNGASAWGVSLVQVQAEGLGIIGNPSTDPLLGAGVHVDEGHAFLLTKEGDVALLAPGRLGLSPRLRRGRRMGVLAFPGIGGDGEKTREGGGGEWWHYKKNTLP